MKTLVIACVALVLVVVHGEVIEEVNEKQLQESVEEKYSLLQRLEKLDEAITAEENRNSRVRRCGSKRAWCKEKKDCCCGYNCVYAWYNQQSSCERKWKYLFTGEC
uniref:Delta-hexatoxin-Mg1a n=1 Tax=Macrothele gigas TaxID=223896 RepID=TXMG4_MACGS|nr:RecName: Full=Delta-hexatoxin-Mg1a; Short=Delta-HXTX-Mg1a; AltName: Full=Neurotoxin magi-4; Flags: Precursor [Macrothele gigas]BAC80149.1 Magi 4 [Macrothele gigas]